MLDKKSLLARIKAIRDADKSSWTKEQVQSMVREMSKMEEFLKSYGPLLLFEPNPPQQLFFNCPGKPKLPRIRMFTGGNRCLGGEVRIPNPATGESKPVSEIFSDFVVRAWNGDSIVQAIALRPFLKGFGRILEIAFSNGCKTQVADGHRFLTPSGFAKASELRAGSTVCCAEYKQQGCHASSCTAEESQVSFQAQPLSPGESSHSQRNTFRSLLVGTSAGEEVGILSQQESVLSLLCSTWGIDPSIRALGEWHYCKTERGFLFCCLNGRDSYGVLFPSEASTVADVFPLRDDVLGHIPHYSLADVQGNGRAHSLSCLSLNLPSNKGGPSPGCTCTSGEEFPFLSRLEVFVSDLRLFGRNSHTSFRVRQEMPSFRLPDYLVPSTAFLSVVSVSFLREDHYYDFTVPVYHNYQDESTVINGNSGKSTAGFADAISFALGERLWDGTKLPVRVPNRGRIVATTYLDGIKKVIEPKIEQWLPKELIKSTKTGQQGSLVEVRLVNGSWFDLVSTQQDSLHHEGADFDWCWFDEDFSEEHWISNIRGLVDRRGYCWITTTPLSQPWMKEKIYDMSFTSDNYHVVKANSYDNVGYGITDKKSLDDFFENMDEGERITRQTGEFLVLQGMVFKEYRDRYFNHDQAMAGNESGHLIEPFTIPEDWPRYIGIDPHDRTPTHILWNAVDPHDDVYTYDELAVGGKSVKDIADAIKEREALHDEQGFRVVRVIDPASEQSKNSVEVGLSIRQMFMQAGIYTYLANHDLVAGHKVMRDYLRFQKTLRGLRPRWFIFDRCKGFRRAMMSYVYDDRSHKGTNRDYKDPKENKVREKDKHYVDTVRYVLMFGPRYWHRAEKRRSGSNEGREED